MQKVIIIIPTYNEALVIEKTLMNLVHALKDNLTYDFHYLVFDSSSTDNTLAIVKSLQAKIKNLSFLTEPKKSGLGSAYHQAMAYAMHTLLADIVIEYDADGSHQPCYVGQMLARLNDADVVVGSRYVKGGSIPSDWGFKRIFLSKAGNWFTRRVLSSRYRDYTSGFRATKTTALKAIWPNKFLSNNYAYKVHLFWLLHLSGAVIVEQPISFIDRLEGKSKLPANSLIDTLSVLSILGLQRLKSTFFRKA